MPNSVTTAERNNEDINLRNKLLEIGMEAHLFQDEEGELYASVRTGGSYFTRSLDSEEIKLWLRRRLYLQHRQSASRYLLEEIIDTLKAEAITNDIREKIFIRVGGDNNRIFIDNAGNNGFCTEITREGWHGRGEPSVRFVRPQGMRPFPGPLMSGINIDSLKRFINYGSEQQWKLLLAWMVSALMPNGPYPILILEGEQGTGKSTCSKILMEMLDPCRAVLRGNPRSEADLMLGAKNRWITCFDNLSGAQSWLSDALCRIATGTGYSTRRLYTNNEEYTIEVARPIILNGIDQVATRADLIDRAIILRLPVINGRQRLEEAAVLRQVNEAMPDLLGGLYDAVSATLRNVDRVNLSERPRMVNYAVIGTALEEHMGWPRGSFMAAYRENLSQASVVAVQTHPVLSRIVQMVASTAFDGSSTELLDRLERIDPYSQVSRNPLWPANPRALSQLLNREAPNLRNLGINITLGRNSSGSAIHIDRGTYLADVNGSNDASTRAVIQPNTPAQNNTYIH